MPTAVKIRPMGNIANRIIQYLAAKRLEFECQGLAIDDPGLTEWGLTEPNRAKPIGDREFVIGPSVSPSFKSIVAAAVSGDYDSIIINNFMQRMEYLPSRDACASLIPHVSGAYSPSEEELVINIRASELVSGISHYPLVPVDFYDRIIRITGLTPVFMGQVGSNAYCRRLRERFPHARMLNSQGPLKDFQTVRSATNVVPSVSTFSWLAAWLSDAKQILLPLLGFLNPQHLRSIDLLPTDDSRYRFFLFPLHFGVPEAQDIPHHAELVSLCREISPQQVDFLRNKTPLIEIDTSGARADFDEVWYCNTYLDAALEISLGWFNGPLEHYLNVGRLRGYRPFPDGFSQTLAGVRNDLNEISLHRPASISSLSRWSVEATVEAEAGRASNGKLHQPYAFHTDLQDTPWWMVDLQEMCEIHQIVVFNRSEIELICVRGCPLTASASCDGDVWTTLFTTPDAFVPGRQGRPLVWTADTPAFARFVRLSVARVTYLHLKQVRILGFSAAEGASI